MNLITQSFNRVLLVLTLALLLAVAAIPLRATSVVPPQFAELVNRSDYVVRGRVKALSYENRTGGGRELIFTKIEVEVLEVIAGTPPESVVLVMLGGKSGDRELVVAGVPQFKVGDEDILFVEGNGRNFYPLYAVMHGKYPVKRDQATGRRFVTRSNEVPLGDVAEVTLPMTDGTAAELQKRMRRTTDAMTPEDFIQRIKQQRGSKRAK
jgi:hypothetical protein